jgi:AraC family transcriptional regulator
MERNLGNVAPPRSFGVHALLDEPGLAVRDVVCGHGRRSPIFGGDYPRTRITLLLSGAFHVRSSAGDVLAAPATLLLGNAAQSYEYRHVDDGGDRSLLFEFEGVRRFRHAAARAGPALVALAHAALHENDREKLREVALLSAEAAQNEIGTRGWSSAQAARVARTLRYIEAHCDEDCSLAALAAQAGLSRHHFLRIFRGLTGRTPRQHVIATRLRAAATSLARSGKPVTQVALEAGFGDLSHFIGSFARAFGASPRAWRAAARKK